MLKSRRFYLINRETRVVDRTRYFTFAADALGAAGDPGQVEARTGRYIMDHPDAFVVPGEGECPRCGAALGEVEQVPAGRWVSVPAPMGGRMRETIIGGRETFVQPRDKRLVWARVCPACAWEEVVE
jgi:hypothetical protein